MKNLLKITAVCMSLTQIAWGGLITHTDYSDGSTISASGQNTNENAIVNEFNGNIESVNILDGTIVNGDIANGTIQGTKIDNTAFSITSGTITGFIASTATITHLVGTTTNDDATLGTVGQVISGSSGSGSFTTSNQYGDITSIALTAGDWDVSFSVLLNKNGATVTNWTVGIGTVSGNDGTGVSTAGAYWKQVAGTDLNNTQIVATIPVYRISIASTTTYYFKIFGLYSVANPTFADATIHARRVR